MSVTFIPAKVFDNPALLRVNPEYITMIPVICTLIGAAFGLLIGYGFGWARAMHEAEAMFVDKPAGPIVSDRARDL